MNRQSSKEARAKKREVVNMQNSLKSVFAAGIKENLLGGPGDGFLNKILKKAPPKDHQEKKADDAVADLMKGMNLGGSGVKETVTVSDTEKVRYTKFGAKQWK